MVTNTQYASIWYVIGLAVNVPVTFSRRYYVDINFNETSAVIPWKMTI
jgi:hypothetical protein